MVGRSQTGAADELGLGAQSSPQPQVDPRGGQQEIQQSSQQPSQQPSQSSQPEPGSTQAQTQQRQQQQQKQAHGNQGTARGTTTRSSTTPPTGSSSRARPSLGTRRRQPTRAEVNQTNQKEARGRVKAKNRTRSTGSIKDDTGREDSIERERDLDKIFGIPRDSSSILVPEQLEQPTGAVGSGSGLTGEESEVLLPPNQLAQSEYSPVGEESSRVDVDMEVGAGDYRACTGGISEGALARILDQKLGGLARADDVNKVMERVDQNAANITRITYELQDMERRINDGKLASDSHIREVLNRVLDERRASSSSDFSLEECSSVGSSRRRIAGRQEQHKPKFVAGARSSEQEAGRIQQYEISRRSLRIWPIAGKGDEEIVNEVRSFLS